MDNSLISSRTDLDDMVRTWVELSKITTELKTIRAKLRDGANVE